MTSEDCEVYIPGVYEQIVQVKNLTTVEKSHYAIIQNPVGEDGRPQWGKRKLVACVVLSCLFSVVVVVVT